jgi:hypothetical protein
MLASLVGFSAFAETSTVSAPLKTPKQFSDRTYKGDVAFLIHGKRFDDAVVNSRYARLFISLTLEANYRDWFQARFAATQILTSGQASNLYGVTEAGTSDGLLFQEASLNLIPVKGVEASTGIIAVDLNPLYSQMMGQSNAGGALKADLKGDLGTLGMYASQSIPGTGTSNRVTDEDTLPLLTVGTLSLEFPADTVGFNFKTAATQFVFTDLSSQAAADAQKKGSTIVGNGSGGYLFAYEFRGTEYAAAIEQNVFRADKITIKGSTVRNELAPDGQNMGWQGNLKYLKSFNKWTLTPSYTRFHMESDALPSAYSLLNLGFSNRDGASYAVTIDFPKEKFSIFGGYVNSNVLNQNSTAGMFQADRDIYTLGAEAKYDIF